MFSFRFQSTEMPVAARNSSRKASSFDGEAMSSEKTGAAMIKLPCSRAALIAAFAAKFKESSSFQRDTRTLVSRAVIIAHAFGETNGGPLFVRGQFLVFQFHGIFQRGPRFALDGHGSPPHPFQIPACRQAARSWRGKSQTVRLSASYS